MHEFLKTQAQPLPSLKPSAFQPRRTPSLLKHWMTQVQTDADGCREQQDCHDSQSACCVARCALALWRSAASEVKLLRQVLSHSQQHVATALSCNQHNVQLPPPFLSQLPFAHELPGERNALSCRNMESTWIHLLHVAATSWCAYNLLAASLAILHCRRASVGGTL